MGRYCHACGFLPCDERNYFYIDPENLHQREVMLRCSAAGSRTYLYCPSTGEQFTMKYTMDNAHHALKACLSLVPGSDFTLHDAMVANSSDIVQYPSQFHLIIRNFLNLVPMLTAPGHMTIYVRMDPPAPHPGLLPILECTADERGGSAVTRIFPFGKDLLATHDIIIRSHLPSVASKQYLSWMNSLDSSEVSFH